MNHSSSVWSAETTPIDEEKSTTVELRDHSCLQQ